MNKHDRATLHCETSDEVARHWDAETDRANAAEQRAKKLEEAVSKAYYALEGGDGPPDTVTAQLWLRTTFPPEHPNYVPHERKRS